MADGLALDLEELRHLQSIAKRPRIVSLISTEIHNLEKVPSFSLFFSAFIFGLVWFENLLQEFGLGFY